MTSTAKIDYSSLLTVLLEEGPAFGLLIVAVALLRVSYCVLFHPLNRIRDLCQTGYDELAKADKYGQSRRQLANHVRRMKRLGDVPPVYPNGWFALCESDDLKVGQVLPVDVLGENLVVFRTETGQACVLDAYCPHLGAHLGIGGRVSGDCIECPFHGWTFDGQDGQCTSIPYSKGKVPQIARVKTWPCQEMNGFVFFWYHAEREEPSWAVPPMDEDREDGDFERRGRWIFRGRTDYKVNAHIQEIPENGADVAHLDYLHGPSMLFGSDLKSISEQSRNGRPPLLQHHWNVSWTGPEPDAENERHISITRIQHDFRLFGRLPFIKMAVEARQIGPGLVHLYINTTLGRCVLIQTVTPVEPLVQRVVHRLYTESSVIAPYAKLILWGEAIMFERDVIVWNHKTYISKPLLVSEDRTILRHRRWYQQFYTENSPRISLQNTRASLVDW